VENLCKDFVLEKTAPVKYGKSKIKDGNREVESGTGVTPAVLAGEFNGQSLTHEQERG